MNRIRISASIQSISNPIHITFLVSFSLTVEFYSPFSPSRLGDQAPFLGGMELNEPEQFANMFIIIKYTGASPTRFAGFYLPSR